MAGKVFISYRLQGADQNSTRRLLGKLQQAFEPGQLVFDIDFAGPEFGYAEVVKTQLQECEILLAIIGRDWTGPLTDPQDHVRIAIEEALAQRKPIVPILISNAPMPGADAMPETIRSLISLKASHVSEDQLDRDAGSLVTVLRLALRDRAVAPEARQEQATSVSGQSQIPALDIPEQGYGPHFEIGDDGIVTLAPPAALDRQGNNIDRLKRMHPELINLSMELAEALGRGNIPHIYLLERAQAYHRQIDQDLDRIDFSLLYMAGVRLANAEKAAAGDNDLPALALPVRETIDSLLRFHGTFILATREGLESIEAEQRYRRTQLEEVEYRKAAIDFAKSLQDQPTVVDPKAAAVVMTAAEDIGHGANPERSGTVATGAMKNIAVTIAAGAAIGAIPVAAVALGSTALAALAAPACLIATESLKKSRAFAALSAAVTKGIDKVTDTEMSDALTKVHAQFATHLRLVLSTKEQLTRLAGRADEFKWLTSIVRWVEQAVQDKQQVADPPPPPEPPAVSSRLNNIYLGRISVIEPALQAAFVDYGAARHGFLSFNDIHPSCYQTPEGDQQRLTDGPSLPVDDPDEAATKIGAPSENELNVADMIKRGQVVLAQISKEPSGNRGARVTTYIELVGRFLVLMPNEAGVRALSKDILHAEERKRLAAMIERLSVPEGMGIIVREVGASRSEAEIKSDLADLVARWDTLRDLSLKSTPPALVYDAASHLPTRAADPA